MKLVTARDYIGQYGRIEAHPSHPGPAGSVLAWVVPVEPDYEADLTLLRDWAGICDHIDHHGYCQTHALTLVDENGLCGIGRLVAAVGEETT